jgi:hypothetical protein
MYGKLRNVSVPYQSVATVGVIINQADINEIFTYEKPMYSFYEFLSDCGGALGLILGLSIHSILLSIVMFLNYVYEGLVGVKTKILMHGKHRSGYRHQSVQTNNVLSDSF